MGKPVMKRNENEGMGPRRSLSTMKLFSISFDNFRSLPRNHKNSCRPMGAKELSPSQLEFFEACRRGDLLKVAGYINGKKNKRPKTPLNLFRPSTPSVGWLVAIRDPSSLFTPLHISALQGHSNICKLLLDADPQQTTARDKKECIPLHLAAWGGHADIVQMLVNQSPDSIDMVNCALETPLHLSSQHGHASVSRCLLLNSASACMRNARNETALDIAARTGHATVCQFLVNFCPEIALQSAVDASQTSENNKRVQSVYPLHAGARYSHIECLQVLRDAGFEIDFVTKEGSALHVAAMFGQIEACQFLIDCGINPNLKDSDGRTAMQLLDELQLQKDSDITQIIQSREGWEECTRLIEEYIARFEKANINSSSDSGIDGKEYRRGEDCDRDVIWQPLPGNSLQHSGRPSSVYQRQESSSSSEWSQRQHIATIPKNWRNNFDGVPRFPVTCPYMMKQHKAVNRKINTLPCSIAPMRSTTNIKRDTILPSSSNVFVPPSAPPSYETWKNSTGTTITYNPACQYDNVPETAACSQTANGWTYTGSVGRVTGRAHLDVNTDGTQTLPTSMRRIRPSLKAVFSPIQEQSFLDTSQDSKRIVDSCKSLREESVGLGNSPCFSSRRRGSKESSIAFACSTLERSATPSVADPEPSGRAPLAQPEEMTGSTTTSIISNTSPDRETRSPSVNAQSSLFTTSVTINAPDSVQYQSTTGNDTLSMDTVNISLSSLSVEGCEGPNSPPSPNTSQRKIFSALVNNTGMTAKLNADNRKCIISPSVTECSDSTVASSCSLPVISQISSSPPSPLSPKTNDHSGKQDYDGSYSSEVRLRSGISSQPSTSDYLINEQEEWNKIEGIMSSFGSSICRESVFTSDFENKVSCYLRDHKSQAITLRRSSSSSGGRESRSRDEGNMINWLMSSVGLSHPMAEQIGELLVANGFDKINQLNGSLSAEWMTYLGIDRQSQARILSFLRTIDDQKPKSESFDYLSDWLCSLELIFYLSNFMEAGFKSVNHFKAAQFTFDDYKNTLKINLIGHILRIMHSLEADISFSTSGGSQLSESISMEKADNEKLVSSTITFSAHYLGSCEISNVDGTEESRNAMTVIKKQMRDLSSLTQVNMEISVRGVTIVDVKTNRQILSHEIPRIQIVCQDMRDLNCFTYITQDKEVFFCHVFSVLTADVATELIMVLGQTFELAYGMKQQLEEEQFTSSFDGCSQITA